MKDKKKNSTVVRIVSAAIVSAIVALILISISNWTYEDSTEDSESNNMFTINEPAYMFTLIEVDNSNTLDIDKSAGKYYYLTDTGIVYAGYCLAGYISNRSYATPVISSNGYYLRYNTETESVEEVE
jgi:hypothetical protein